MKMTSLTLFFLLSVFGFGQTKWKDFVKNTPDFNAYGKVFKIDDYKSYPKINPADAFTYFTIVSGQEGYMIGKIKLSGDNYAFVYAKTDKNRDGYVSYDYEVYGAKDKKRLIRWAELLMYHYTNDGPSDKSFKILKHPNGALEIHRVLQGGEYDNFKLTHDGVRIFGFEEQ